MAMQQCPNGHLFDDAKHSSCPYCSNGSVSVTVPLNNGQQSPQLQQMGNGNGFPQTAPLEGAGYVSLHSQVTADFPPTTPIEPGRGVTMQFEETSMVIGWLVCLEGEKRGVDFKIHGERNTIGRGSENDIKLDFDNYISKGVNAIIAYDKRNNKFFISLGDAKNNIYVNNQMLMTYIELKDYDVIEIGSTKMIFRSLCNEKFSWENTEKSE